MSKSTFLESLRSGRHLVSDGATGSNLIARGLPHGTTPEDWVMEQSEQIIRLHQEFIRAGADLILTSTFGATSLRLAGSALAGRAGEVNQRAVELARQAVGSSPVWVAGSLGPVGGLLKPYGPLEPTAVTESYTEQARALAEAAGN
jgi:5-methyltetrahydrofolate--homocysteine methyltransferase